MDYGFTHHGVVFTPNNTQGVKPEDNDSRNADIARAELAVWKAQPSHMLAYYKLASDDQPLAFGKPRVYREAFRTHGTVSTWTGEPLGVIIEARVYRHNFGGRFVALRVQGNNGAAYYGRASYDWGSCVNLRRVKK